MAEKKNIPLELTPDELRYIIRSGGALVVNIPELALPTYCGFTKDEIYIFCEKMREILDLAGLDL